jgi:hypothetical protein
MSVVRRVAPIASRLRVIVTAQAFLAIACTGTIESDLNDGAVGRTEVADPGSVASDAPAMPSEDAGEPAGMGEIPTAGATGVMLPNGGGGAGGAGSPPPAMPEPVCDAVTEVLLPSCGGGSCHSNPSARIGDWAVGRSEAESFVDVPSVRNVACGLIIDSGDPSQSLLLRKLIGDFPIPMCGGPMPVSGPDLTDQQIACMASWLQQFRR